MQQTYTGVYVHFVCVCVRACVCVCVCAANTLPNCRCLHCHTLLTVDQEAKLPCSSKRCSVCIIHYLLLLAVTEAQDSPPGAQNDWKRIHPFFLLTVGCLSVRLGRWCTTTRWTLSGRSTPTSPSCSPEGGASGRCTGCEQACTVLSNFVHTHIHIRRYLSSVLHTHTYSYYIGPCVYLTNNTDY